MLKAELEVAWQNTRFVYNLSGREYDGILDDYDDGKCDALAIAETDLVYSIKTTEAFCDRGLVLTDSLVIENVSLQCS